MIDDDTVHRVERYDGTARCESCTYRVSDLCHTFCVCPVLIMRSLPTPAPLRSFISHCQALGVGPLPLVLCVRPLGDPPKQYRLPVLASNTRPTPKYFCDGCWSHLFVMKSIQRNTHHKEHGYEWSVEGGTVVTPLPAGTDW